MRVPHSVAPTLGAPASSLLFPTPAPRNLGRPPAPARPNWGGDLDGLTARLSTNPVQRLSRATGSLIPGLGPHDLPPPSGPSPRSSSPNPTLDTRQWCPPRPGPRWPQDSPLTPGLGCRSRGTVRSGPSVYSRVLRTARTPAMPPSPSVPMDGDGRSRWQPGSTRN